jgi:tRNA threonylcarbamoyladenosine biosynthesis protein TsaE
MIRVRFPVGGQDSPARNSRGREAEEFPRNLTAVIAVATSSPQDTQALAAVLSEHLVVGDLIVLAGDLGAGKTCFAQGLGAGLGIVERMTSPTFTLVNRYESGRLELHHLDVYRLDDIAETLDLDLPELLEVGVTVIEWGEEIDQVLPVDHLTVRLQYPDLATEDHVDDDERLIHLEAGGPGWSERLKLIAPAVDRWIV